MDPTVALRRAQRWFWLLTVVAILLVGLLSRVVTAEPGPLAGIALALTGIALALVITQVCRLMLAIGRAAPGPRRRLGRVPSRLG
ncbi:MAG: hypothetical protein U0990_07965 [Candidatus Nanopelagicales bacterium]|nr:hypothetical protein [Candidatus Nanopelagicales bacterium]MDZ4250010.1 hypothetical protein [Candidatus Nanopelagicales bacterium]